MKPSMRLDKYVLTYFINAGQPGEGQDSTLLRMKSEVPLRRIVALFHRYRRLMLALLGLVLLESALGVVAPFLLRAILDRGLPDRNAGLVTVLALGMIGSSVASGALGVTTSQLAQMVGQRVMHDLRVGVYAHLQRMSLGFFT